MARTEPSDWLLDPELVRLRGEWVHAYHHWADLGSNTASAGEALTDEQRDAERRYRAAETAYFAHSRWRNSRR